MSDRLPEKRLAELRERTVLTPEKRETITEGGRFKYVLVSLPIEDLVALLDEVEATRAGRMAALSVRRTEPAGS